MKLGLYRSWKIPIAIQPLFDFAPFTKHLQNVNPNIRAFWYTHERIGVDLCD